MLRRFNTKDARISDETKDNNVIKTLLDALGPFQDTVQKVRNDNSPDEIASISQSDTFWLAD